MDEKLFGFIIDLAETHSTDLTAFDEEFLIKSLIRKSDSMGMKNPLHYCKHLKENALEADSFFQSLFITYTQFFREPFLFAYIEQRIIPNLIHQAPEGSEIRVWSAGCSSGQEAYSLAILLDEQLKSVSKTLRFRVFATDVSAESLAAARKGVYSSGDIQNVRLKHIQTCFSESDGRYAVIQRIKDNVNFSCYDLLDADSANPPDSIFGNFDIVCCNNLLMYYKKDVRLFILHKIEGSLAPTGTLTVSEAERAFVKNNTGFQPIIAPVAVFNKPDFILHDQKRE